MVLLTFSCGDPIAFLTLRCFSSHVEIDGSVLIYLKALIDGTHAG